MQNGCNLSLTVYATLAPDVYLFFCLEMADKTPEMPVKTVEII